MRRGIEKVKRLSKVGYKRCCAITAAALSTALFCSNSGTFNSSESRKYQSRT